MDSKTSGGIVQHTTTCLDSFAAILSNIRDEGTDDGSIALGHHDDTLARFRIWASNLGAYHPLGDRRSADYRLRDAPEIAARVVELLKEIADTNYDIIQVLTKQSSQSNAPSNQEEIGDGEDRNELTELFLSVGDAITSLMKVSMLVRKATGRDRYLKAASSKGDPFLPEFDMRHVADKHPKVRSNAKLLEKLGLAITQRRQFLRYSRDHKHRIAHIQHSEANVRLPAGGPLSRSIEPQGVKKPDRQLLATAVMSGSMRPTLAPTTASTLDADLVVSDDLKNLDHDDDAISQSTSFASSRADEEVSSHLHITRLSDLSKTNEPFECPYCFGIVQAKRQGSWRKHVLEDLRAYMCTFTDCKTGLFETKEAWSRHEMDCHRRQWTCQICNGRVFKSIDVMHKHLLEAHGGTSLPLEVLTQISETSSRPVLEISAGDCPLCDDWESNLRSEAARMGTPIPDHNRVLVPSTQFCQHLAFHQEQLALFAIPPVIEGNAESDSEHIRSQEGKGNDSEGLMKWQKLIDAADADDSGFAAASPQESNSMSSESPSSPLPATPLATTDSELLLAVLADDFQRTSRALGDGADPNVLIRRLDKEQGLLHIAIKEGCAESFNALIIRGHTNINLRDYAGWIPLHRAAYSGRSRFVKMLLEERPFRVDTDAAVPSSSGGTALSMAAEKNYFEIVTDLLYHGANPNAGPALLNAVFSQSFEAASLLLRAGSDPNTKCAGYVSLLGAAAARGDTKTMALLLDHGASIDEVGSSSNFQVYGTALCTAVLRASMPAVKLLVDRGADVGLSGPRGSPMDIARAEQMAYPATEHVYAEIIEYLANAEQQTESLQIESQSSASFREPAPEDDLVCSAASREDNTMAASHFPRNFRFDARFRDPKLTIKTPSEAHEHEDESKLPFQVGQIVYVSRQHHGRLRYSKAMIISPAAKTSSVRDWSTSQEFEVPNSDLILNTRLSREEATLMMRLRSESDGQDQNTIGILQAFSKVAANSLETFKGADPQLPLPVVSRLKDLILEGVISGPSFLDPVLKVVFQRFLANLDAAEDFMRKGEATYLDVLASFYTCARFQLEAAEPDDDTWQAKADYYGAEFLNLLIQAIETADRTSTTNEEPSIELLALIEEQRLRLLGSTDAAEMNQGRQPLACTISQAASDNALAPISNFAELQGVPQSAPTTSVEAATMMKFTSDMIAMSTRILQITDAIGKHSDLPDEMHAFIHQTIMSLSRLKIVSRRHELDLSKPLLLQAENEVEALTAPLEFSDPLLGNQDYRERLTAVVAAHLSSIRHVHDYLEGSRQSDQSSTTREADWLAALDSSLVSLMAVLSELGGPVENASDPLYKAVEQEDIESVRKIAQDQTRLRASDGIQALHLAVANAKNDIAGALLSHGIDPNGVDKSGNTPLAKIVRSDQPAMVKTLLSYGADASAKVNSTSNVIVEAVKGGHPDVIRELLGSRPGLKDAGDGTSKRPLHHCVLYESLSIAQIFLDAGADVNAKDQDGTAPIDILLRGELTESRKLFIGMLLDRGAQPTAFKLGRSGRANLEIVMATMKHSRHSELPDETSDRQFSSRPDSSRLRTAASGTDNSNADLDTRAWFAAVKRSGIYGMKKMLEEGFDVNVGDEAGLTALHHASLRGDNGSIVLLLEHGADVALTTETDATALDLARKGGNDGVVKHLARAGASTSTFEERNAVLEEQRILQSRPEQVPQSATPGEGRSTEGVSASSALLLNMQEKEKERKQQQDILRNILEDSEDRRRLDLQHAQDNQPFEQQSSEDGLVDQEHEVLSLANSESKPSAEQPGAKQSLVNSEGVAEDAPRKRPSF